MNNNNGKNDNHNDLFVQKTRKKHISPEVRGNSSSSNRSSHHHHHHHYRNNISQVINKATQQHQRNWNNRNLRHHQVGEDFNGIGICSKEDLDQNQKRMVVDVEFWKDPNHHENMENDYDDHYDGDNDDDDNDNNNTPTILPLTTSSTTSMVTTSRIHGLNVNNKKRTITILEFEKFEL